MLGTVEERKKEIRNINLSFSFGIFLLGFMVFIAIAGVYGCYRLKNPSLAFTLVCLGPSIVLVGFALKWNRETLGFVKERHRIEDEIARIGS